MRRGKIRRNESRRLHLDVGSAAGAVRDRLTSVTCKARGVCRTVERSHHRPALGAAEEFGLISTGGGGSVPIFGLTLIFSPLPYLSLTSAHE